MNRKKTRHIKKGIPYFMRFARKKAGYMLFTLLLATAFIGLSMFSSRNLLKRKEADLLSGSGTIRQESPVSAGLSGNDGTATTLTIEEIQDVVGNWSTRVGLYLHEPVEDQITMKEAVKNVDEWLIKMGLSEGIYSGNSTVRSTLNVAKSKKDKPDLLSPIYSFWQVAVSGDELEGMFYVNAVTGQIWEAHIDMLSVVQEFSESQLLESFIYLAGLIPKVQENTNEVADTASGEAVTGEGAEEEKKMSADKASVVVAGTDKDEVGEASDGYGSSIGIFMEIADSNMIARFDCERYSEYIDIAKQYDKNDQAITKLQIYVKLSFYLLVN